MMLLQIGVAGFSRYEDIVAWQLADELKREVFALTATGLPARDFKFRDQIRDSSASATRNIAEGFGRFRPAEFARFLEFARGSLTETHNSLRDGRDRGYFTAADCDRLSRLAGRAAKATSGLIRYLRSGCDEPLKPVEPSNP
jgi:four helix bundle protein